MSKKFITLSFEVEQFLKEKSTPARPIKSPEIERRFNLAGSEVRKVVNLLRLSGAPICSGPFGYFYSEDKTHLKLTFGHLHSRAISMLQISNKMKKVFGLTDLSSDQLNIFEGNHE